MSEFISQGEMKKKIKQALLEHDEKILRTDFGKYLDGLSSPDEEMPYNYYELLRDTLNELFAELPDDEYLAALDVAPWWHDGQFIQFGLADDRKLFETVKRVINDWDPEGLLTEGAPDDEYVMEIGEICSMLKSARDIDEIAWGVYDVLCKCFGTGERKRKSVFPEYTITAGKLMAAIKGSGLKNFGHFVEKPYTITELTEFEQKFAEFIKEIEQNLAVAETPKELNEYLNILYESLESGCEYLSCDDLNSLYEYCISEAMICLWRRGDHAFKEKRYGEIKRILSELWKYKTKRPRLKIEFPEGLWRIYDTWDKLSDENKLTFGNTIDVEVAFGLDAYNELVELRKKQV